VSQTRSDAEDLDGTSDEVEVQDAAEREATKSRDKSAKKSDAKKDASKKRPTKKPAGKDAKKSAARKRTSPRLFYRQIIAELRKVVWPTRSDLITYTTVVIVFVVVIIAIVAALDAGIGRAVQAVFG
jgi:preprotein translocase subunit SecE